MTAIFKLHLLYLLSFVSDCKRCLFARTSHRVPHFPSELAVTPQSAFPHLGGTSFSAEVTFTLPILCSLKPHRHRLEQHPVLYVALLRLQLFLPSISSPGATLSSCFALRPLYSCLLCVLTGARLFISSESLLICWPETLTHNSTVKKPQPTPNSLMWYTFLKSPYNYCQHFKPCLHLEHGDSHLVLQISFVALSQNCEKRPSAVSCLSVRPHGTARLLLDGLSWNLIFKYFSKICP